MRRPSKKARDATPNSDEEEQVQTVVEEEEENDDDEGGGDESTSKAKKSGNAGESKAKKAKTLNTITDDEGVEMIELGNNRFISVSEFKGKKLVNVREYYEKDGKRLPTKKGISLTPEQYENLKKSFQHIDDKLAEE